MDTAHYRSRQYVQCTGTIDGLGSEGTVTMGRDSSLQESIVEGYISWRW